MRYIEESTATERYNDFLDEIYGEVVLNRDGGLYWQASRVVAEMDPTAYRCGMNDWLDSEDLTTDADEAETCDCGETITEENEGGDGLCDDCYGAEHAFDDLDEIDDEDDEIQPDPFVDLDDDEDVCEDCGEDHADGVPGGVVVARVTPDGQPLADWERDLLGLSDGETLTCQWYAMCANDATTTERHPILGDVPICQRCKDKNARLSE